MQNDVSRQAADQLRAYALSFPGATEEFPWGESVAKVAGKIFVYLGRGLGEDGSWSFGVKLPVTGASVRELPLAQPMGYGLDKAGWVVIRYEPGQIPDAALVQSLVDESFRAVAPKRLLAEWEGR